MVLNVLIKNENPNICGNAGKGLTWVTESNDVLELTLERYDCTHNSGLLPTTVV